MYPQDNETGKIVLRAKGICKSFPGVQALQDFSFEVRQGEVHAIVGENGAGKSTLVKIIVREYLEEEGEILIGSTNLKDLGIRQVQDLGVGIIHQDLNLVPMFTVAHNICMGQEPVNRFGTLDWSKMRENATVFLKEVSTDIDPNTKVEDLSTSQKQLVTVARALAKRPKFLILDEPTARLDQNSTENLFAFLERAKESGLTVIYISHRLDEIYRICDRITVLRDGRKILTSASSELSQNDLVRHMVGREIKEQVPKQKTTIGDVLMSVQGLRHKRGGEKISLNLRSGEILGIVGSIGSGKSELARAIFGADPKHKGQIIISNKEARIADPVNAIAAGISLIPEERKKQGLILDKSIRENMTLVSLKKKFCAGGLWIRKDKETASVRETIEVLNLAAPDPETEVHYLSGGTQQKVVVAKWLMNESNIYIFDEPTKGIDVGGKHEIYRLIGDLTKRGDRKSVV